MAKYGLFAPQEVTEARNGVFGCVCIGANDFIALRRSKGVFQLRHSEVTIGIGYLKWESAFVLN